MKRRRALKTITTVAGTSLLLPTFGGCKSDRYKPIFFSTHDLQVVDDISETILPKTQDAPGAHDCYVANFVDTYINDCYSVIDQGIIQSGIETLKELCQEQFQKTFNRLQPTEKENFLIELDAAAKQSKSPHYFTMLKRTIVFAYFTSKDGIEGGLDYVPIPGKYIGDYPMKPEQKTWAI